MLKPFLIKSHTIRLAGDSTPKGCERKDFADAFARYLPDPNHASAPIFGDSKRHNATTQRGVEENGDSQAATEDARGASKNGSFLNGEKDCGGVADESPETGVGHQNPSGRERFKL